MKDIEEVEQILLTHIKKVEDIIEMPLATCGAIVAGGCIRDIFLGLPPIDIDIFFCPIRDPLTKELTENSLYRKSAEIAEYKSKVIKKRARSIKFQARDGFTFDMVLSNHAKEEVTANFDFTCVDAYYNKKIILGDDFLQSVYAKKLNIKIITLPWHSLARVAKMLARGWTIDIDSKNQIIDYCMKASWGFEKEADYLVGE